jgi:hypothetical protein
MIIAGRIPPTERQAPMQDTSEQETPELSTDPNGMPYHPDEFADALDLASDQDTPTWITDYNGKRVAVLVPVEVLEFYLRATDPRIISVGRLRQAEPAQS